MSSVVKSSNKVEYIHTTSGETPLNSREAPKQRFLFVCLFACFLFFNMFASCMNLAAVLALLINVKFEFRSLYNLWRWISQIAQGCQNGICQNKKEHLLNNLPSKWLRNSLVTRSRTFHNDDEGHRICMVITLIVVEDSKAWSGWHGDNPITRNTLTANYYQ